MVIAIVVLSKKMPILNEVFIMERLNYQQFLFGKILSLKNLFNGLKWKWFLRSDRFILGTLFFNYIENYGFL